MSITPDHEFQEQEEIQSQQSKDIELIPYQSQQSGDYNELTQDQSQQSGDTEIIQEKYAQPKRIEIIVDHEAVTQEQALQGSDIEPATQSVCTLSESQKLDVVTQEPTSSKLFAEATT